MEIWRRGENVGVLVYVQRNCIFYFRCAQAGIFLYAVFIGLSSSFLGT